MQAALTGHFVMSSLHATDASAALHRFLDMGIEPFLLASSLLGVVGQRLVRRNCPHCIEPYYADASRSSRSSSAAAARASATDVPSSTGAGCNFCGHTGYFERVGVYEVLSVTEEIRELIVKRRVAQRHPRRRAASRACARCATRRSVSSPKATTTIAEVLRTVYVL